MVTAFWHVMLFSTHSRGRISRAIRHHLEEHIREIVLGGKSAGLLVDIGILESVRQSFPNNDGDIREHGLDNRAIGTLAPGPEQVKFRAREQAGHLRG
jgi:hypothetical protein